MHQSHYGPSLKLPIANCNWLRRDDQSIVRLLHRCLLLSPPPPSPLCLPCSALGHVLQTFCCRLLKVISLLRAAYPPPSPRSHRSNSIWFLRLHVDAFSLHVLRSCRKVAARLRCWACQRAAVKEEGRVESEEERGDCICCSICGSLSAI